MTSSTASPDTIIRIAARGDGVTADGRYAALAAPGDLLRADGSVAPGPHHRDALCKHFTVCGGCELQHVTDDALADFVRDRVVGALEGQGVAFGTVRPAIVSPEQSRRRADLRAMRMGGSLVIGFNAANSNKIVDMRMCPLLRPELFALIAPLRTLLSPMLRDRRIADIGLQLLDQGVEVVLTGVVAEGLAAAEALQDFASKHALARLVIDSGDGPQTHWEPEPATMRFGGIPVVTPPHCFLQPTAEGEAALIAAAAEIVGDARAVADLFCGVGTFALSLSEGRKVYAAEASRDTVMALASAASQRQMMLVTEHRDLYRRPLTVAELGRFGAVVLDPPRSGAEDQVAALAASNVPRIAYISCNPATFARDAAVLVAGGYMLDWVQPVGQFRWSTHVELAGCFTRQP